MVRDPGHRRWRGRPWRTGVGALVLLPCALAACQVAPRQPAAETGRETLGRGRSVTAGELARGRWSRLPEAPIPDRGDPAAAWTGRELLVWGGQSGPHGALVQGDGAAYDPASGTWRRLAPSPRPQGPPLNQHLAWTGSRLLVWTDWERLRRSNVTLPNGQRAIREEGRDGVDVWTYDPAADRWAVLGAAPGQPALGGAAMVWTGREVLSLAGRPYHGPVLERDPGSRYDLARNRWRPMADGPLDTAALSAVLWTGAALLVWNGESEQSGGAGGGYQPGDGAAWDPLADRWLRLPRSPLQGRLGTIAVWTGDAALVWGGTSSRTPGAGTGMVFTAARS